MKKFAKYLLTLGIAALSFAACEEEQVVEPVNCTVTADSAFKDYKATITVTADKAAVEDMEVEIRLDVTSVGFKADDLDFPASVKVEKGQTEATATVEIKDPNGLEPGDYKAVFGAVILGQGPVGEKVAITWSKADLSGKWSVIGLGGDWNTDIVMDAADGGWYVKEGVVVVNDADAFKFRKDGKWDLALGLVTAGNAPLDKEFEVSDAPGGPNIGIEKEGIYTLSVNPNHKVAKVVRTADVDYVYSIKASDAFDATTFKNTLTASCNRPVKNDVTITLALDAEKTTFPEGTLSVPESITIAKGAQEGTADVAIIKDPGYGEFTAVINATIGEAAVGSVTVSAKKDYPAMQMSDIQAKCTSSSNASFLGKFEGLYVNYILGTQHIYLEDASGAIRFYSEKGKTVKVSGEDHTLAVGDKISGVLSGTCRLDSGRPTINWLDFSKATVVAAPAEEQPKPVTGTLKSFTDATVASLMYRRVILDNLTLDADIVTGKSSQIITVSDATGSISLHVRFTPSKKYVKGSHLSGTGTFDVANGKIEIRIFAEKEVTITAPELAVERLWGKYPVAAGKAWTTDYASSAAYIVGNDRTMAMDEEYVYVAAASSSTKGILAISIADPSVVKNVNVDGVEGGLFATACVRTIYNPQTKKHMLLVGSLAYDGDYTFNVYAYTNGIDAAPTKMISWATNNRRVGDFFTVSGDVVKGEIWARTNIAGTNPVSFKWNVTNGVPGTVMGGQMGYSGAAGMGSVYKYNVDAKQALVVTPTIGRFFSYKDDEGWLNVDNGGVNWAGIDNSVMARKFGITPFEFNGKKYIAYVKKGMYNNDGNAARARLKIIEDQGSADTFLASMEADKVLYEFPIQNSNNATTEAEFNEVYFTDSPSIAGQEMANCAVIVKDDAVYIAAHLYNVGVSVFKMYLK